MADALRRDFPTVDVRRCALSNQFGRANFVYLPTLPAWSGLRPQPCPVNVEPQQIEVEVCRLDDLVPKDKIIDFIKIDVEGAELEVLEGARETIRRSRPHVLFEHAKIHNTYYDTTPGSVYTLLHDAVSTSAPTHPAMTGTRTRTSSPGRPSARLASAQRRGLEDVDRTQELGRAMLHNLRGADRERSTSHLPAQEGGY